MALRLDELPPEIINGIIISLSGSDCCNLRLVSRALQWKAVRQSFRDSFRRKSLEINEYNLESFVAVTQPGRLGCMIQDLSLCGLLIDYEGLANAVTKGTRTRKQVSGFITLTCEDPMTSMERSKARSDLEYLSSLHASNGEMIKSQKDVMLLTRALRNISINSPLQQLLRLSIEVRCIIDVPSRRYSPMLYGLSKKYSSIWPVAAQTFQITMAALAESELRIRNLIVFNSSELETCSLFQDQLQILSFPRHKALTSHLKTLSLSLLARDGSLSKSDDFRFSNEVISETSLDGLNSLIAHCTALKGLMIHYYSVNYDRNTDTSENYNFTPMSTFVPPRLADRKPARLERLILAGLIIRGHDLLEFLMRNQSAKLVLDYIKLTEGSFRPIFDFLTTPDTGLMNLELTSLHEGRLICFPKTDQDSLDSATTLPYDSQPGTISLRRHGYDVLLPIEYYYPPKVNSFKNYAYTRHMVQSFGPLPNSSIS